MMALLRMILEVAGPGLAVFMILAAFARATLQRRNRGVPAKRSAD